jgi:phage-related minor tail protein
MATTDATINVKVVGLASLTALQNNLGKVQSRFAQLQNAVLAVGFGAFTRNALLAADSMADLANATGLTIEQIIDLQTAMQGVGGRFDQVNTGVLKFTTYIDEAVQSAGQARKDFNSLGVSLEQLRTLSEAQLLQQVIDEIAQETDATRRAALMMKFFGKSMREVDAKGFSANLRETIGTNANYAESVRKAALLNDNLEKAIFAVKLQFLEMISPLVNVINYMNEGTTAAKGLKIALEVLGAVALAVFGGAIGKTIGRVIGGLGRFYNSVKRSTKAWQDEAAAVAKSNKEKIEGYQKALESWKQLSKNEKRGVEKPMKPVLDDVKAQADKAVGGLKNWEATSGDLMNKVRGAAMITGAAIAGVIGSVSAFFGIGDIVSEQPKRTGATGKWEEDTTSREQNTDSVVKQTASIKQQTQAYAREQEALLANIKLQQQMLGLNEDDAAVLQARNDVLERAKSQIQDFKDQIAALSEDEVEQKKILEEQIVVIQKRMKADAEAAATATKGYRDQARAMQDLIADIELLNSVMAEENALNALQRQSELIGLVGDELRDKQIVIENEIALQERLAGIEAKRITARYSLKGSMLDTELDRLNREEAAARASAARKLQIEKDLNDQTKALRDDTSVATKQFLEDLARSIDPAVLTAQRWETVFKGIENSIDTLVTTGKINFKDFALSIIADLLRIQMRAIVVQAILSAIGAIFGKAPTAAVSSSVSPIPGVGFAANGAKTLAGQPFVVGEQGPELFVPKTAGTIVPNDKMNGQVNAPVTNNYVTYNINAMDSRSVAQVFAENRKALLGAVGMAQKEMPYMMG